MKFIKLLFFITIFWTGNFCFSQRTVKQDYFNDYKPQDPTSATFQSYGDISVNHFTGQPNIKIPLGGISSYQLSENVSLSFDAKGIKIDQFSGPVGINWQMNVGGSIERELRGMPDEMPNIGYLAVLDESQNFNPSYLNERHWVDHHEKRQRDTEHDVFHVNINGRAPFKLVFNSQKELISIPASSCKIDHVIVNGKINSITLQFPDGSKYTFGDGIAWIDQKKLQTLALADYGWEEYKETTIGDDFINSGFRLKRVQNVSGDYIDYKYNQQHEVEYTSKPTWTEMDPVAAYIDKQDNSMNPVKKAFHKFGETPAGSAPVYVGEIYNWDYFLDGTYGKPYTDWEDYFIDPDKFPAYAGAKYYSQTLTTEKKRYLTSIEAKNNSKIYFTYVSGRTDLPGALQIDNISIYNQQGLKIQEVKFDLEIITSDYLTDLSLTNPLTKFEKFMVWKNMTGYGYSDQSRNASEFVNVNDNIITRSGYRDFIVKGLREYNYKRLFLKGISFTNSPELYQFEYKDPEKLIRRVSDRQNYYGYFSQDQIVGNLIAITYKTNARSEMNYISNQYHSIINKLINKLPDGSTATIKAFAYDDSRSSSVRGTRTFQNFLAPETSDWYKYEIKSNIAHYSLIQGAVEGYQNVTEFVQDGNGNSLGRTEYEFEYSSGQLPQYGVTPAEPQVDGFDYRNNLVYSTVPHVTKSNQDHFNGKLKSVKVFDNTNSIPIQETYYVNKENPEGYNPEEIRSFVGGKFAYTQEDDSDFWNWLNNSKDYDPVYRYRWYYLVTTAHRPIVENVTNKRNDYNGNQLVTTTELKEVSEYPGIIREEIVNNADGSKTKTVYTYPFDLFNTSGHTLVWSPSLDQRMWALYQMTKKHMINAPIETRQYYMSAESSAYELTGSTLTTYKERSNGIIVPFELYVAAVNSNSSNFNEVDVVNNVLQYDSRYVKINDYTFDDYGNPISMNGSDGQIVEFEYAIQNSVISKTTMNPSSNNPHVTHYDQKPMIGPTQITDLNGHSINYTYDQYNRLKLTKDEDGNILERYTYHYNTDPTALSGNIEISGLRKINTALSFRAREVLNNPGKSKYIWDFGDGTIEETYSTSINHSYTTSGLKKVKMVIDNPETEELKEFNTEIYIYGSQSSLSVCTSIRSIDLCTGNISAGRCGVGSSNDYPQVSAMATLGKGANCGGLSYRWSWRKNGGSWRSLSGSGSTNSIYTSGKGTYEIRCIVTDDCGYTYTKTAIVNVYESTWGCAHNGIDWR